MKNWVEIARQSNHKENKEKKRISDAMNEENLLSRWGLGYEHAHAGEEGYTSLSKRWEDIYKRARDYYNNDAHKGFYDTYSGTRNKQGYVSDTGRWYSELEGLRDSANEGVDELLAELDQYSRYYNEDAVKYVRGLITERQNAYNDAMKDAGEFRDIMSQWNDAKAYDRDVKDDKFKELYNAGDYDAAEAYLDELYASAKDDVSSSAEMQERMTVLTGFRDAIAYQRQLENDKAQKAEYAAYDVDAGQAEIDDIKSRISELEGDHSFWDKLSVAATELGMDIFRNDEAMSRDKEIEELNELLVEKEKYHDEVTRWKNLTLLQEGAAKDPDFESYAEQGMKIENPSATQLFGVKEDDIGNIVTYSRENADLIRGNMAEHADIAGDSKYAQMTDDEVKIYSYYLAKYGKDKAQEYLNAIDADLIQRETDYLNGVNYEFAQDHPFLSSAASVITSLGSGVEYAGDALKYLVDGTIDPYRAEMDKNSLAETTNTVRGAVTDKVDWEIGEWDAFDFLYNTGMSGADSLAASLIPGGSAILGLSAAAQGTNDALERGLSSEQAFWNGAVQGAFEGIFESVSIGKFKSLQEAVTVGGKDVCLNIAKSMLVNASEEAATEAANILYDTIANGDFSNYEGMVQKYISEGLTPDEAESKAKQDLFYQVLESAASGAIMGAGFGGIGSALSYKATKSEGAKFTSNPAALIDEALRIDPNDKYALSLKAKLEGGKKVSQAELGKLSFDNTEKVSEAFKESDKGIRAREQSAREQVENKIEKKISSRVEDKGLRSSLAQSVTKAILGENVSNAELRQISKNEAALRVLNKELGADFDVKSGVSVSELRNAISSRQGSSVKLSSENILATVAALSNMDEATERGLYTSYATDVRNGKATPPEDFARAYTAVWAAGKKGVAVSEIDARISSVLSESALATAYKAGERAAKAPSSVSGADTTGDVAVATESVFSPQGEASGVTKEFKGSVTGKTYSAEAARLLSKAKIGTLDTNRSYYKLDDLGIPKKEQQAWIDAGIAKERAIRGQTVVTVNTTVLKDEVKRREFSPEVLQNGAESGTINTIGKEAQNEQGIHLRDSGERYDGQSVEGQIPGMEGNARPNQIRREDRGRPRDAEAVNLSYDREVSAKDFGISGGLESGKVKIVAEGSETTLMKEAKKYADENGLNAIFFGGGNLKIQSGNKIINARAFIQGKNVYVRVDHSEFTADQLIRHEGGHDMIDKGEIDIKDVRKRLKEKFTPEEINAVARAYLEAYKDTGLDADEVWTEIICDSLGDMNIFEGTDKKAAAEMAADFLPDLKETALEGRKEARAPPKAQEGKASIDIGGENANENSSDTGILEGRKISTANRSGNDIREYSKNTRKLKGLLGYSDEYVKRHNIKAGETGWLEDYQGANGYGKPDDKQKARRLLQRIHRELSGIKLNPEDTAGRKLPQDVLQKFSNTIFKTDDGTILSLWHWTGESFSEFTVGDIGFHAGTFDAAHAIMYYKSKSGEKGIFKEMYFNSKKPLFLDRDIGKWTPHLIAVESDLFNSTEMQELSMLDGYDRQQYDSEASIFLREMVKAKGYDAIVYTNDWEGGLSVIAFDNDQFYTVAENGIDVNNHTDGHASFDLEMLEATTTEEQELSDRERLAAMLESEDMSPSQKGLLTKYKNKLSQIEANEAEISKMTDQLDELKKSGKGNTSRAVVLENKISKLEKQNAVSEGIILNLEATKPIKRLLEREREAAYQEGLLAGQMAQGKDDAPKLRRAEEKLEAQKQSAKDKLADQRQKSRDKLSEQKQTANEKISTLQKEKRGAYKEGVLAGQMAQGRRDAEIIRHANERIEANARAYLESRAKSVEGRRRTKLKEDIRNVVQTLDTLLRKGNKKSNVKIGLQDAVAAALEAFDINAEKVERYNKDMARLDAKIAAATDPMEIEALKALREKKQRNSELLSDKLAVMKKAYEDIHDNADGENYPSYYRAEAKAIMDRISDVIAKVGDTPISEMTSGQLKSVYDMYRMVLTTVRDANKAFIDGKLEDLTENASAVESELRNIKKLPEERLRAGDNARGFVWNELTPYYAFNRIGSKTLMRYYEELVRGQDVYARDLDEAKRFAENLRKKYKAGSWNRNKIVSFKDKDGRDFRLNLGQMMSIYAYSKRDQALDHMEKGGFFFNNKETFRTKGGIVEFISSNETGYKIDAAALSRIKSALTADQIAYVDKMQAYLTDMGAKGNEVSRQMWGIDIFNEKVYFPLKSKEDFIYQANTPAETSSLKNDGMTKETKPHASNPIVLEAFDEVWANHVEKMSKYHGFVIPIDNLNKIINYGSWIDGEAQSISTMLEARYSIAVNDYLTTFIKDLNGAKAQNGGAIGWISNQLTKFKKTAVAASLSVVVQQPTAIIRATSEIDAKYFAHLPKIESLNKKWEQIQKYAPIAIIKDIGGFDAGSGRSIAEWINANTRRGVKRALNKIDDVTMYGAALGDRVGWGAIWTAVGREVQAKQHLKYGTEEFWQACGKRFTEVIVKTQVYDSTLSRSGFMRGKDSVMKMATSFMGEPTLSVNMIADSILQAKRGEIKKRQVIRTVAAVYTATVAASIIKSFIYALRDDDEDESLAEKYMQALGGTILNDINPLSMLPVTRDVVSILEGWDVGRSDMEIVQDLYNAITALDSEEKTTWRKIEDLAGAMGALAGVPAKNFLRTAREIYNLVNDMFDGIEGGDLGGAFVEGVTGKDKSKSQTLYEALIDGDPERIYAIKNYYKTADDYAAAVRKALRDYDPRIKKAGKALYDGDLVTRNDLLYEIVDEGVFDEETVLKAIDAEADKIAAEVKAAEKAESDVPWYDREADDETPVEGSIYSASDIGTAFDHCSDELALEIIAELTELKVGEKLTIAKAKAESNGEAFDEDAARVEAEDSVRSTLRSTVTKHYKPLYRAAYASGDRKEMQRIADILKISGLYVYKTSRDLDDVLNEWIEEE